VVECFERCGKAKPRLSLIPERVSGRSVRKSSKHRFFAVSILDGPLEDRGQEAIPFANVMFAGLKIFSLLTLTQLSNPFR
jgi:hypothetical protein